MNKDVFTNDVIYRRETTPFPPTCLFRLAPYILSNFWLKLETQNINPNSTFYFLSLPYDTFVCAFERERESPHLHHTTNISKKHNFQEENIV